MSEPFRVDASDFAKAAEALSRQGFETEAGKVAAATIRKGINAARRHVRAAAKPHRKTGRMSGNVRTSFTGRGLDLEGRVFAGGRVAHLITGGVKPHAEPGPAKQGHVMAIHGPGRSGPVVAFARHVEHPGFGADPFFARGVDESHADIEAALQAGVDSLASDLAARIGG